MIKLYDKNLNLLQILNNTFNISYSQKINEVHTASFCMPFDDQKVSDCDVYNFVEIFDNSERVDLFRIMPNETEKSSDRKVITFQCEHVLSTLLDDIIFQYNVIASSNDTTQAINTILGYQTVSNWVLNTCDFAENYEYKNENTNLLNAIFNVPKLFNAEYQWTWNTSVYPWELSLIEAPTTASSRIVYRRNLKGVKKKEDPTNLVTRLYPLGAGEGINQVTIKSVNSGVAYLDASTIVTYGTISKIYADKNIETPEELKAVGQAILEQNKNPIYEYTVDAANIYKITGESLDKFILGEVVQVDDSDVSVSFAARIVSIDRPNIVDNPGDISIGISNKKLNINNTISNLEAKIGKSEVTAQGSSCIDSISIQENCDKDHGGILKFFLSDEVVYVNKCILNYSIDKFRAYEKSIASEAGSTQTSTSGGSSTETTTDGGSAVLTSVISIDYGSFLQMNGAVAAGSHSHPTPGTSTNGLHSHDIPDHEHEISVPDHSHNVTTPSHTHDLTIPSHTHNIDYGIYEFATLPPSITLKVDGTTVPGVTSLTGNNVNIINYLSTDGNGSIDRGTFHTVEIIPDAGAGNAEGLARIVANINWKVFLRNNDGSNL